MDHLLRLRLIVARVGEQDGAGWWNANGQMGPVGALTVARGMPKTHAFARARSVFTLAAERCAGTYPAQRALTLWRLPPKQEDAFDACWAGWLTARDEWSGLLQGLEDWRGGDLLEALRHFGSWPDRLIPRLRALRPHPDTHAIEVPALSFDNDAATVLAAAFALNTTDQFRVPYLRLP